MFVKKSSFAFAFLILCAAAFAAPAVFFVQPAANYTEGYSAFLNVSVGGPPDTFRINWNGTNATILSPSLLGAWNFEGDTLDWSQYGNGGTRVDGNASNADGNTPPSFASGKFGSGLSFDGVDDYLNLSTWTDSAAEVTIEAWIFKRSSKNQDVLTKKWDGDDSGYKLWVLADDRLELQLRNSSNSSGYLRSSASLANDTWYHVAGTYNGSEMRLYVNGALDSSKAFAGGIALNGYVPLVGAYLGARSGSMAYVFNGTLDEVRVHSRAKPAAEIGLAYNGSIGRYYLNKTGLAEGVYAYYAWANDSTGANQTALRTLTVDRTAPAWLQSPQNRTVEYGASLAYDLNATDNVAVDRYRINDSVNFKINPATGLLENNTLLGPGIYLLNASANDTSGHVVSALFKVTVSDTTPPAWDQIPANQTVEYGAPFAYDLNASDTLSIDKYSINDTANFKINPATGLLENNTLLGLSAYMLNVTVNDTSGNRRSALFKVTVQDTQPPSWDQAPANQTVEYGTPFAYDLNASDNIAIDRYKINDTSNFKINAATGLLENNTLLSIGVYPLNVTVNDTSGNRRSALFNVTVRSTKLAVLNFQPPSDGNNTAVNRNYTFFNVTASHALDTCLLEWNQASNVSATVSGSTCYLNRTGLADGWYTYKVFANNTFGSWNSSERRVLQVDTTPPTVSLSYYPNGWSYAFSLAKSESDPDSGIVECRLEYSQSAVSPESFGAWTLAVNYSSPCPPDSAFVSYVNSNVATHNRSYKFRYSARNGAGSWSYANITNVTKLDLTAPAVAFSYPDAWLNWTLNIPVTNGPVDGESGVAECVMQYKNLTVFNNTLQGSFAAIAWVNVSSGNDCTLANFSGVNGRAYKFRYNVRNNVGNWSGWTAAAETAQLDVTPPEFVNLSYPNAWQNASAIVSLARYGNDSQSGIGDCELQYRNSTMNNGLPVGWSGWMTVSKVGGDCASSFTGVQGQGYQFRYRIRNNAGSWSNFTNSSAISQIDFTEPDASITYTIGWQTSAVIGLITTQVDAESGIVGYDVEQRNQTVSYGVVGSWGAVPWTRVSNATPSNVSPSYNYTGANGYAYQFRYLIRNGAGIWSDPDFGGDPGFVALVDTTPPLVSLSYSGGWKTISNIPITTSKDDPESNVSSCSLYYLNATLVGGVPVWAANWTLVAGSSCGQSSFDAPYDGQAYRLKFSVTNAAGNTNESASPEIIYVDATPPSVSISYPDGWRTNTTVNVTTYAEDAQSQTSDCDLEYNYTAVDHGSFVGWSGWLEAGGTQGGDCPQPGNGTGTKEYALNHGYAYVFRYRVNNSAGTWSNYSYSPNVTKIDTTPPVVALEHPGGWRTTLPLQFTIKVQDDPESGVAYCNLSFKKQPLPGNSPVPGWYAGIPSWTEETTLSDCTITGVSALNGVSLHTFAVKLRYNITNNAGLTNETIPVNESWVDIYTSPPVISLSYTNGWRTNETINSSVIAKSHSDTQSGIADCDLDYMNASISYGVIVGPWSPWKDINGPGGDCGSIVPALIGNNGNAYQFRYNVTNRANMSAQTAPGYSLMIDVTPPVDLSFDYDNTCYPPCWNGWRRSNPVITFTRNGTDLESDIDCDLQYQYATATAGDGSLNAYGGWQYAGGSQWGDCTDTFNASSMGSGAGGYKFRYTIRNGAGTPSPSGYIEPGKEIKLEFTPPLVNFTRPGFENVSTTIHFLSYSEYDGESGIAPDPNGCILYYKRAPLSGTYGYPTAWDPAWTLAYTTCSFTELAGTDGYAYLFNYTVKNQAGLVNITASDYWTGIDTTPPDIAPSISYPSGWQTNTLMVVYSWSGTDNQSGRRDCDLEFDRNLLDHGSLTAWSGWAKAGGVAGGDCNVSTSTYNFTEGANGYAYRFRFNVQNGAWLWYGSYASPGNILRLDVTPPNATLSYATGWINTSAAKDAFTVSHTEDDAQSGLLANNCIISYKKALLDNGSADLASAAWVVNSTACAAVNPYPFPLEDRYAYQFNYTVRNINYNGPNTENATAGGVVMVDVTNATNVSISYPDGWITSNITAITRGGRDLESGIADCDLEYRNATVSYGVIKDGLGDAYPWMEANGTDGSDCAGDFEAAGGNAYIFRYRVKNGAGLWTEYVNISNVTKVDNTPPVTYPYVDGVAPSAGWYTSEKNLTLIATDPESLPNVTRYSIDLGVYQLYTASRIPVLEGIHNYTFYSTNLAGGVEPPRSVVIKKDTTPPSIKNVKATPSSVEWTSGTPIVVTANVTDLSGIAFANVCKTSADCQGNAANRWCSMTNASGTWSCTIDTSLPPPGMPKGLYSFYVSANDTNNWFMSSVENRFKVRKTNLWLNASSANPIDMQSTGIIIAFYAEDYGTGITHIPKADCTLSGDFSGMMVDTSSYYGKIVRPAKLGNNTYALACSKEGYATMSIAGLKTPGKDFKIAVKYNPVVNVDGVDKLKVGESTTVKVLVTRLSDKIDGWLNDSTATVYSYTITSTKGEALSGNLSWDNETNQWRTQFTPGYDNYTTTVYFRDNEGIENSSTVVMPTVGALKLATDAQEVTPIEIGASSIIKVYVSNDGENQRKYNLTFAGNLDVISVDGIPFTGKSEALVKTVESKSINVHVLEIRGKLVTPQPQELAISVEGAEGFRDFSNSTVRYQVLNRPEYGVMVAPDLGLLSLSVIMLLGLAYVSRRK